MNRRTLLTAVGAGVAGPAGCSDTLEEFGPTEDGTTTRATGRLPGRPGSDTAACRSPDDRYSNDALPVWSLLGTGDRVTDLGCPTFEWVDNTVCQHGAFEPEPAVMMSRTQQVYISEDSDAQATFALTNRSGGTVETHPRTWTILEPTREGEDWSPAASGGPSCTRTIPHEESHWREAGIGKALTSGFIDVTAGTADLEPGTYVFAAPASLPEGDHVMCAAPFDVVEVNDTDIGGTPDPMPVEEETPRPMGTVTRTEP